MLYSILKLPQEPIIIVQIRPPLSANKHIYSIDREVRHLLDGTHRKLYRIDDFTRVQPHQFTLQDALDWFTGDVREDAMWRANVVHMAAVNKGLHRLMPQVRATGAEVHVDVFRSLRDAVDHTRVEIAKQSRF